MRVHFIHTVLLFASAALSVRSAAGQTFAPPLTPPQNTTQSTVPEHRGPPPPARVEALPRPASIPVLDPELWWEPAVTEPIRSEPAKIALDTRLLWKQTLQFSENILALRESPLIEAENIIRAQAEFDPTAFLDNKFRALNDPVGNTLTTGGPPRLLDNDWDLAAGYRDKLTTGGRMEVSQLMGFENSNSVFFTPQDQGTGRLTASFRQPLLRGAGWCYNQSFIVLAELNTRTAEDQFTRTLHDQLVAVARGYWQLYLQRSSLLQQRRHLARATEILASLEARREVDTAESQVVRVRAAIAQRKAGLTRAEATVRDTEARLRALVNAPDMIVQRGAEMLPRELPHRELIRLDPAPSMQEALRLRPEVDASLKKIDAARVRLAMSQNEVLPSLSFLVEGYVAGLEGNSGVLQAVGNQFTTGGPGYTSGLFFEMPLGNRAALAKNRQQNRELVQAGHQFRALLENLATEVEVAVREVATSHQEFLSNREASAATRAEVEYLLDRWSNLAGEDRSASLLLEDILQAQDRLVDEERALAQALANYNIALVEWKRVTGTLIRLYALPQNTLPDWVERDLCAIAKGTSSEKPPPRSVEPNIRPAPNNLPAVPALATLPRNAAVPAAAPSAVAGSPAAPAAALPSAAFKPQLPAKSAIVRVPPPPPAVPETKSEPRTARVGPSLPPSRALNMFAPPPVPEAERR